MKSFRLGMSFKPMKLDVYTNIYNNKIGSSALLCIHVIFYIRGFYATWQLKTNFFVLLSGLLTCFSSGLNILFD